MSENIFEKIEKEDKLFSKKTGVHLFTYSLVGGIVNCIEIGILLLLVEKFHVWYIYASVSTMSFGLVLAFIGRKNLVFKKKGLKKIHKQMAAYVFIFFIELCINYFIMTLFVEALKFHYTIAYIISVLITGIIGFLWNRNITFK